MDDDILETLRLRSHASLRLPMHPQHTSCRRSCVLELISSEAIHQPPLLSLFSSWQFPVLPVDLCVMFPP
ncbi:hypothetical protein Y032_0151g2828 [Ancylostoma ceylanicum]|uniref:Uncharacterized protein n=1 Tax=Ancylostoma ceylanicum TaxID=53326 RepID=A0A016T032_9BILA|nr:hypothetical protein Y032_0151g2828 [Ancylostoma ceylanicum]